jgi:hypothetical protein
LQRKQEKRLQLKLPINFRDNSKPKLKDLESKLKNLHKRKPSKRLLQQQLPLKPKLILLRIKKLKKKPRKHK